MNLSEILICLDDNVIPNCLDYVIYDENVILDPYMMMYNSFYWTNKFVSAKFPQGLSETDFFEPVIDLMIEQNKTKSPLEELEKLHKVNK